MNMERKRKQDYLREEIIEKQYDPEAFTAFCEEKKGNDIDSWNFEELVNCVIAFKRYQGESKPNALSLPGKLQGTLYTIPALSALDNELSLCEHLKVEITCSDENIKMNQMLFIVRTSPLKWVVRRKLEDFDWLKLVLSDIYTGVYIPPGPSRREKGDNENSYLNKQLLFLQNFIDCLTRNALVKTSPFLLSFLHESNNGAFNCMKKQGKRTSKNPKLEENWSLNGCLICDSSENQEELVGIRSYLLQGEALKKKLAKHSDFLVQKLKDSAKELNEISMTLQSLESIQNLVTNVLFR